MKIFGYNGKQSRFTHQHREIKKEEQSLKHLPNDTLFVATMSPIIINSLTFAIFCDNADDVDRILLILFVSNDG